jgi:hypothetical protein
MISFAENHLMKFPLVFLLTALSITISVSGQQSKIDSFFTKTPFLIKGSYQLGKVLPTNDFIRGDNLGKEIIDDYTSFSVLLLKQTTGAKLWEQIFGYPVYGIGVYTAFFHETTELGNPISVYGYFSGPFVRFQKLSFNYELGLGLAFNWNDFNPVNNPDNISIGADRSVHMEAGVNLEYQLARRFSASVGFGFNHFSNGKLKMPNMGLNTEAVKFSLLYQINNPQFSYIKREVPKFEKHNEWDISFYAGAENVIYNGDDIDIQAKYRGLFFPVYGLNNTFNRCVGYKSKIGAGFTVGYNGALNAQIAVEDGELEEVALPFVNHITLSVYPSYELVINRLSVIVQPGFYVYRKTTELSSTAFYQRLGVKYHFYKDYFLGVSLRATQFHVSNYIEWNIGRRISL